MPVVVQLELVTARSADNTDTTEELLVQADTTAHTADQFCRFIPAKDLSQMQKKINTVL